MSDFSIYMILNVVTERGLKEVNYNPEKKLVNSFIAARNKILS